MTGEGKGWISLYRSIQDHWLWQEKPFSKGQAWLDLLLSANHQDKKIVFDSNLIEVKRGEFITSIRKLCERWGWSNSKVKKFLDLLQDDGMIYYKSDTKKTAINIVKYKTYQILSDTKNVTETAQTNHRNITETPQKHTNNNDNNVNNYNNDNNYSSCSTGSIEEITQYYCGKAGIVEFNINPTETQTIIQLINEVPLEIIKQGIDEAFNNYKPKFQGDKIKSFKYCEPVIKSLYAKLNSKEGAKNGNCKQYIESADREGIGLEL
ncbi:DNA replication protein DnaD [Clostridium thermopalmarium]|uniref:Uncharacterized protein n=1 Tax=Clostridium thermopalmarium DSM 5974 TaxID=1121340 RepID=A0A2T0APE4_9CLOT|nr:DNA replication protein DnaD [Clostridium thermopalmarium]PRR70888.1 hypothetical protein CPAL_19780 [Clostridium thermopalmarium DSM 5974]PVZ28812.1 DNA replication protein DnaD [Clostridium thermopalmarium DSM 5974]